MSGNSGSESAAADVHGSRSEREYNKNREAIGCLLTFKLVRGRRFLLRVRTASIDFELQVRWRLDVAVETLEDTPHVAVGKFTNRSHDYFGRLLGAMLFVCD